MKGIFSAILCITGMYVAHAQSLTNGTISFQIGYDAAVHGTASETKILGIVTDTDTSGAVTSMFHINGQYHFASWFSAGLSFDKGSYVEDTADVYANGNSVSIFAIDARLYPVNKDKFNWYVGGKTGFTNLEINKRDEGAALENYQYNYKSPHLGLFTGFNWYIFNVAGVFFQLEYLQQSFDLKTLSIDGAAQDLTNIDQTLITKGAGVRLGVSFKIN